MGISESTLARDPSLSSSSFVVDDFNDAQRKFFLAQVPIIISKVSVADNGLVFDLPGRNSFLVESSINVHLDASIDGGTWHTLNSNTETFVQVLSQYPWRYFKLRPHTPGQSGTATFAAVKA